MRQVTGPGQYNTEEIVAALAVVKKLNPSGTPNEELPNFTEEMGVSHGWDARLAKVK